MIVKRKPKVVILYDAIPLFSYYLVSVFTNRNKYKVWYHNHDKINIESCKKYSVSWFAAKFEDRAFKKLDIFTLPAKERLEYFNIESLRSAPYIIPNYPSLNLYKSSRKKEQTNGKINLVYQGSLGPNHGFEEIIKVLNKKIDNKSLTLTLLGKIRPTYKSKLLQLAAQEGVADQLVFKDYMALARLPSELRTYSIGLAIHKPVGITYSTGGTASNKIYEYMASVLPVILYDTPHYRHYLEKFEWTFFTDLKEESLLKTIKEIDADIQSLF